MRTTIQPQTHASPIAARKELVHGCAHVDERNARRQLVVADVVGVAQAQLSSEVGPPTPNTSTRSAPPTAALRQAAPMNGRHRFAEDRLAVGWG